MCFTPYSTLQRASCSDGCEEPTNSDRVLTAVDLQQEGMCAIQVGPAQQHSTCEGVHYCYRTVREGSSHICRTHTC
jgi:hypothetical protein